MRICGTVTKILDDGTEAKADWMFDSENGEVVQIGGEGVLDDEDMELVHDMLALAQEMDANDAAEQAADPEDES